MRGGNDTHWDKISHDRHDFICTGVFLDSLMSSSGFPKEKLGISHPIVILDGTYSDLCNSIIQRSQRLEQ